MSEGRLIHDRFSHLLGTTTYLSVEARVEYGHEKSIYAVERPLKVLIADPLSPTPVTQGQRTRERTTNATEINKQS